MVSAQIHDFVFDFTCCPHILSAGEKYVYIYEHFRATLVLTHLNVCVEPGDGNFYYGYAPFIHETPDVQELSGSIGQIMKPHEFIHSATIMKKYVKSFKNCAY